MDKYVWFHDINWKRVDVSSGPSQTFDKSVQLKFSDSTKIELSFDNLSSLKSLIDAVEKSISDS